VALTSDEIIQINGLIHEAIAAATPPARYGMIVPNSYKPADATVSVLLCDTAVVFDDDPTQQPMVETDVPLTANHIDDAHGPFGGELVHLQPFQGGYTATIHRQPGGTEGPAAPQGERWILLRNSENAVLAYIKMTQNGASASDGAGGIAVLAGTLLSMLTAAGRGITSNDSTQQTILGLPSGKRIIIDDAAGDILIGEAGLTANDRVMTESKTQTLANAILSAVQTAFDTFAATVESGSGAPPPTLGTVTASGSTMVESEE
jgi:hypothetical protein